MTISKDFAPVAETGELEATGGLFGRLGRRHNLEPLGGGFTRILLDEHGRAIFSGDQLSAGQKYWARARSWVKIDTGTHRLAYDVEFSDPSGSAGFVAKMTVTASVQDAEGAAQDGCTSAEEILVPVLREAIEVAGGKATAPAGGDPIETLSSAREQARAAARKLVGKEPNVPNWLAAKVTAVSVDFDTTTAKHHADLVEKKHGGHLIEAKGEHDQKEMEGTLKVRDIVRENLAPHLRDSLGREIEAVVANPSTENLNAFASKISEGDMARQEAGITFIKALMDGNYIDKDDPVHVALLEMSSQLIKSLSANPAQALGSGQSKPEIEAEAGDDGDDAAGGESDGDDA